jgi:hypothetical protein
MIPVSLGYGLYEKQPGAPKAKSVNPAIKALVINHMWLGVPQLELPTHIPTIVVGRDLAEILGADPMNHDFMKYTVTAENLETAMNFAYRIANTDKVYVFDGCFGAITCSPSLAEYLMEKAPEVSRRVDQELMPKWLRQRGFDPANPGNIPPGAQFYGSWRRGLQQGQPEGQVPGNGHHPPQRDRSDQGAQEIHGG